MKFIYFLFYFYFFERLYSQKIKTLKTWKLNIYLKVVEKYKKMVSFSIYVYIYMIKNVSLMCINLYNCAFKEKIDGLEYC